MIINLILDRIEGDKAILKTEDKLTIVWPREKLPPGVFEGAYLTVAIASDQARNDSDRELAKDILNEILNAPEKPVS